MQNARRTVLFPCGGRCSRSVCGNAHQFADVSFSLFFIASRSKSFVFISPSSLVFASLDFAMLAIVAKYPKIRPQ